MTSEEIKNELSSLLVDNNERLNILRDGIEGALTEEYKRGLNDAWKIAQKVVLPDSETYNNDEMIDIFQTGDPLHILREYCGVTVMNEVREYEIRKKKEAEEFKRGDVIEYTCRINNSTELGIYICSDRIYHTILERNDLSITNLNKTAFTFKKTGDHVDI